MNKSTLSQYGWVVIVIIVLVILMGFAAPFGQYFYDSTMAMAETLKNSTNIEQLFESNNNITQETITNYTSTEIEANEYLYAIGKTKSEYVVAEFNNDFTEVVITKNGEDSDGLMKDFTTRSSSIIRQHDDTIETVVVKGGVVSIGKNAFRSLVKATQVNLPEGLKTIDYCAFHTCSSLTQLTIPSTVEYIGEFAFLQCNKISTIKIPASVNHIGSAAFSLMHNNKEILVDENSPYFKSVDGVLYNKDLTTLVQYPVKKTETEYNLLNTTKEIMAYAFADNSSLEKIILPEGLTQIETYAFSHLTKLQSISLPSSIKRIKESAFVNCLSLNGDVVIPRGLTLIGEAAFGGTATEFIVEDGNQNYKSVDGVLFTIDGKALLAYPAYKIDLSYNVPEGVTRIGERAFTLLRYLENINLSSTVTSISYGAFSNGNRQKLSVLIPDNVTNIDNNSFFEANNPSIKGVSGSAAETFANNNGYTFIAI